MRSYLQLDLTFKKGAGPLPPIKDLQRDLRQLGYLKTGIDGVFGPGTAGAVKALQHDLLTNDGRSRGGDGNAPVRILDYNHGRVVQATGVFDQPLGECMADMLDDPRFPKLPFTSDPAAENRKALVALAALPSLEVPLPFLLAVLAQESDLCHFCVPTHKNDDNFIVVGLDTNASEKHIITSRGCGGPGSSG